MSRRSLRNVFAALALGALLAPAVPAHAEAGPRARDAGPLLLALVPHWLVTLWDSVTGDPGTTDPATGTPDATSTPSGSASGDAGLQADPDG